MHRKNAIEEYCLIDQQPQPDQPTQPVVQRQPAKPAKVPPEPPVSKSKPDSLDQMIEVMLTDTQWNEPVCMRYELTADQFKEEIADFKSHCTCYDKHPQDLSDAKRHFCSWLSQKKYSGKSNKRPTVPKPTGPATYEYDGFGSKDN
jgi:hypothetical protein